VCCARCVAPGNFPEGRTFQSDLRAYDMIIIAAPSGRGKAALNIRSLRTSRPQYSLTAAGAADRPSVRWKLDRLSR
jgi:hypothetical protein